MTAPATYTMIVTAQPEVDAKAAHAARYTQDDYRINAEGTVSRARIKGEVVWTVRYLVDMKPTIYLTWEQAARLGMCHCGKPAQYVGFEGLRCSIHQKYGMSMLCSTVGCTQVSETGFSSHCKAHTTPAMREAREAHQQQLRTEYAQRPYRY